MTHSTPFRPTSVGNQEYRLTSAIVSPAASVTSAEAVALARYAQPSDTTEVFTIKQ